MSEQESDLRTIPTHVGRTKLRAREGALLADHPHARGENNSVHPSVASDVGPSPRTWGEPCPRFAVPDIFRTIPTHVGRTPWTDVLRDAWSDHPHARGEN